MRVIIFSNEAKLALRNRSRPASYLSPAIGMAATQMPAPQSRFSTGSIQSTMETMTMCVAFRETTVRPSLRQEAWGFGLFGQTTYQLATRPHRSSCSSGGIWGRSAHLHWPSRKPRESTLTTNGIERLHEEFKQRIKNANRSSISRNCRDAVRGTPGLRLAQQSQDRRIKNSCKNVHSS